MRDRMLAEVKAATAPKNNLVRWPGRPAPNDGMSTQPAPAPQGPSGKDAIAWVRDRRRKEREAGEAEDRKGRVQR